MRPNTKENSENKQKCQYNDETIISQAVYQTEDRPKLSIIRFKWIFGDGESNRSRPTVLHSQ